MLAENVESRDLSNSQCLRLDWNFVSVPFMSEDSDTSHKV